MCKVVITISCGKEHKMKSPTYPLEIIVLAAQPGVIISLNGTELSQTGNELPQLNVGEPITELDFVASGGTGPYTYDVEGALPDGVSALSDDVDTLRVTGTPTTAGSFDFTFQATDSLGAQSPAARAKVKIGKISAPPPPRK